MIGSIALLLIGLFAGVLSSGYIFAVLGGLKTDVALARTRLSALETDTASRLYDLEHKIASNLP